MKTNAIRDYFPVLLATGALAFGLPGPGHAVASQAGQTDADAPAAGSSSGDYNPKIERSEVVATGEAHGNEPEKQEEQRVILHGLGSGDAGDTLGEELGDGNSQIIVATRDGDQHGQNVARKEVAWLGVSTEEASEALAAQLGLHPGEGLLVTYVATNSPAASAGLKRNDLLVNMDGQILLLPAQLRKLVRMHHEGDKVELTYYRGGTKQSSSAIVGKTKASMAWSGDTGEPDGLRQLHLQLQDLSGLDGLHQNMMEMQDSLARTGVDRNKMQVEIRRSVEQACKSLSEAMAQAPGSRNGANSGSAARELNELARSGVEVDKDATVTIKRRGTSVRTMVKSDDQGSYVIVASPKKHLTAHDKDGKLLFDGEIETREQQRKVPPAVWSKVEPMLEQLNDSKDDAPALEDPAPKKTSTGPADDSLSHSSHLLAG